MNFLLIVSFSWPTDEEDVCLDLFRWICWLSDVFICVHLVLTHLSLTSLCLYIGPISLGASCGSVFICVNVGLCLVDIMSVCVFVSVGGSGGYVRCRLLCLSWLMVIFVK